MLGVREESSQRAQFMGSRNRPSPAAWVGSKASGHRILELPVYYYPRTPLEGKKVRLIDGIEAIVKLVRCRFS